MAKPFFLLSTVVKILFNSIISTEKSRFMTGDIKNFYLMTPLKRWEYVKICLSNIPTELIDECQPQKKVTREGHINIEIRSGIYRLPQAGLLAQELLEDWLMAHGYHQNQLIPVLW